MNKEDHKKVAIIAFNKTWEYIDMPNKTEEQNLEMIHLAHTSRHHWGHVGTELNKARGEWQISRVYSLLNMGESALRHAEASLKIVDENKYGDFDLVFAYEALAFAYKVLGNTKLKDEYLKKGYESLELVKDKGDKDYCKSELDNLNKKE